MNAISYTVQININELSRLLTAATVSKEFRELLLSNPQKALEKGYNGEVFHLDEPDLDRILSIQAMSLNDFAQQLVGTQELNSRNTVRSFEAQPRTYVGRDLLF
ncbi:MAG: hypothetical protein P1S60_18135 [Anaerolineae bacterium]|nr:hypothetical protein [Anaerolineae bacterium]